MINSHKFKKICYNGSFEIFIKDNLYGYLDFIRNDISNYAVLNLLDSVIERNQNYFDILDDYIIKISSEDIDIVITDLFYTLEQVYKKNLTTIFAGRERDFDSSIFHTNSKDVIIKYIKDNNNERYNKEIKQFFFICSTI